MGFRLPVLRRRSPEVVPKGIDVVPMKRRHVKVVAAIEADIFPSPWSVSLYISELAQPATRTYLVARSDGEVVGYAGLMLAVGEGHVTTIGVATGWQRRGIGRLLLLKLAQVAVERGAADLTLEVRMTNSGAQALYHEFGFGPAGIRKNYYAEVGEDALVMWAHGIQDTAYRDRLAEIERRVVLRAGMAPDQTP
jgi:[ribosomal protein S18]-alanine N-acetyltransferase